MKKLRRLDIGENDFGLPRNEVPVINFHTSYPERDPNLKNNWRGRNRKDPLSSVDLSLPEASSEERAALSAALLAGSSIRKRHADEAVNGGPSVQGSQPLKGDTTEEIWGVDSNNSSSEKVSDDAKEKESCIKSDGSENTSDVDSCVPEEKTKELPNDTSNPTERGLPEKPEEEDWDNEIIFENDRRYNGTYRHPVNVYQGDADPHFFLPSDDHIQPVHCEAPWFCVEQGQFDDADDL